MKSFQNHLLLQNLYRLKALGFNYTDPIAVNHKTVQDLPQDIEHLNQMISQCHLCDLNKSRQQSMAGFGNIRSKILFIDDYVSSSDDESHSYFSGRSGDTLQKMIENVLKIDIHDIYITHLVKCKPYGSNLPSDSEYDSCKHYLFRQLEIIKPKIVVTLGENCYQRFTNDDTPFEDVRGHIISHNNYKIIPIYHPSFLLRNPSTKKIALQDLQTIKGCL
jgi:DNA polymerase